MQLHRLLDRNVVIFKLMTDYWANGTLTKQIKNTAVVCIPMYVDLYGKI